MSTAVWPPIPPDQLLQEEAASQTRELEWLLGELQETLQALKAGLEECAALLAPSEFGATLVLSTVKSETLKGFITREGTRIVKGDVKLRVPSLPPPRGSATYDLTISTLPSSPTLTVPQLVSARTLINTCLDIIDVSTWTGDAMNANFISGQLRLLHDNLQEARHNLKGSPDVIPEWNETSVLPNIFTPPLPANVAFHLYVSDAAILVEIRTLEPAPEEPQSGFSLRGTLAAALGSSRVPLHDEVHRTFEYRHQKVCVKEKVRVESQDPSLISAMAKLSALEHTVSRGRLALSIVMDDVD
ncbi:hypothetical protein EJ05DRAFT_386686 [Pseudovirgaria hyperparasitica]|uniref:RAVE subunit 2/Rogdi n=1 Tax=Pseudovirgaria hyperparasitica TaxID=470096 RepID=A0A6A6W5M7_9PEZI|nr:uncharacterized protein EJ05DRAFT_386686 [Pseudovirgaria hyperparasitica]KAF2757334.1 hypothetical protein EJ05DRAFT_386686 [Pseudovirgaria hyperparasitica]